MSEWSEYAGIEFKLCNLQVNFIATNSKNEYKLSFSLETISDFDK